MCWELRHMHSKADPCIQYSVIVHLANLAIIVRANLFYCIYTLKWRKLNCKVELIQTYPYLLYLVPSWAKEPNHILCQRGSLVLDQCLQLRASLTYIIKISLHECIGASRFPSNQKNVIFSQEIQMRGSESGGACN